MQRPGWLYSGEREPFLEGGDELSLGHASLTWGHLPEKACFKARSGALIALPSDNRRLRTQARS